MDPSSSSSVILEPIYDVFLSFRGEDTRHNFTGHLYSALCQKNILTFMDEEGLEKGDAISTVLLERIEKSKVSIIIFSKDYASSTWCLNELAKIIECKKMSGQIVVPVFYHINPSDIRKQMGSFKDSFDKHEERFRETPERVQRWRDALTEAAGISGWDTTDIRSERELVGKIVQDVLKKLDDITPPKNICEGLVGIEPRIEQIKSLLSESRVLGIWGMGGIGKTTLAKAFFKQMSTQFEGCCIIENVREELKKGDGLRCLQGKIFSRILGDEKLDIVASDIIPPFVEDRLRRRKVLVVLDDVDNSRQLKLLIRELESLGVGSRIIITTRDKQVLASYGVKNIYEVVGLNYIEALLLFSKCAFKKNHPPEHLQDLSDMILAYAEGNPLALEVLGSSLCGKSKEDWESVKDNLEMIGGSEIHDVLKISYDGLNGTEKSIFLDIACFFNQKDKDVAKNILEACYESTQYCLSVLIDKALIKISNYGLQMHDLLQEMGRKIVLQESDDNPGKRSRLWDANDIYRVLQNNEGTDAVKSIVLDMCLLHKEICLSSKAFKKMVNLRVLKLYWEGGKFFGDCENISKVYIPEGLKYLSNELRYLHWDGYPWKKLPSEFSADKLVELKLPYSKIKKLKGTKHFYNLKSIDVSHSKLLTEFPRLQNASKLETINLEGCEMLRKAPSSINHFTNLELLDMSDCKSLRSFSRNIHFTSPINIDFSGCINLKEFPQISGNVRRLCLDGTAIEEVPTSVASLKELLHLDLSNCSGLRKISTNICKLGSLEWLDLENCLNFESFPEIKEEMKKLSYLFLSGTTIKQLPSSIEHLTSLEWLKLRRCRNLATIPSLICNLLNILSLEAKRTSIIQIPSSIAGRELIYVLDFSFCNLTELPESIGSLFSLQELDLSGNKFESLPRSIKQLSNLQKLHLSDCSMLQSIPELPLGLEELNARNCKQLKSLPELPSNVEELCQAKFGREFNFRNCTNLNQCISRQRIQKMATALQLHHLKVDKKIPAFSFVLPGSEIPKWFKIKSFGSSIAVKVPPHWCIKGLIGFALSVVITSTCDVNSSKRYLFFDSNCAWVDGKLPKGHFNWLSSASIDGAFTKDQVAIGFFPCGDVSPLEVQHKIVTFEIYSNLKVKCCGLSPIYEEPSNSFESIAFEFSKTKIFGHGDCPKRKLPDVNTSGSGVSGSEDEEAELPPPKRNRNA